jgi:hypothetical protein
VRRCEASSWWSPVSPTPSRADAAGWDEEEFRLFFATNGIVVPNPDDRDRRRKKHATRQLFNS